DDGLLLASGSPCIDAGSNSAVLAEISSDITGNPRFHDDDTTADTGEGTAPIVDMGAYEYQ
ncbi:MAG: choice-of-anchor Q domain-containing protein, partial [Sediminispirochaetaceae bacterium]